MLVRIVFALLVLRIPVPERVIQHAIAKALASGRESPVHTYRGGTGPHSASR